MRKEPFYMRPGVPLQLRVSGASGEDERAVRLWLEQEYGNWIPRLGFWSTLRAYL